MTNFNSNSSAVSHVVQSPLLRPPGGGETPGHDPSALPIIHLYVDQAVVVISPTHT